MSSNYLPSENMSMIGRLLAEIRQRSSQPDSYRATAITPLRPPQNEADRRRINDTVGKRRRTRDIHERNRLI